MRGSVSETSDSIASFFPAVLRAALCSQINPQQGVLHSQERQGSDRRKQRRANVAEQESSDARPKTGVHVETAGLRKLSAYLPAMNLQAYTPSHLQSFTDPLHTFYLPPITSQGNSFDLFSYQADNLFSISQPPPADPANYSADTTHCLDPSIAAVMTDISVREGASFFQAYFEIIHPRYPFLDVEECSTAYLKWKTGEIATCSGNVWSMCLLKLVRTLSPSSSETHQHGQIFANGAILQHAWLDNRTRQQQELILQEQNIMADSSFKPLARVQAMLLHAFHELHGESTARVAHIVGVVMRFAILNGFHCLTNDGTHETDMKIKAWWCIYCIDGVLYSFDLRYFAHMCKLRQLHSEILTFSWQVHPDSIYQCLRKLPPEIDRWAKSEEVFAHGHPNSEGHASPLGVVYVAHMTRVVLYSSVPFETTSETTDKLLQAYCTNYPAY
ncbi:hypothetical protein Forpi1262_v016227 [Fusarium oxysporum f. sp. raphani]|uniref:Xylanolytic transcriptional activator regulatory domain-containing protein n=1 Tax=Fusarium oxysporum f. sp. raphani TaxID=96318 RepID=A0A8J5PJS8_FUSOX|nr:hypothetical protein Forpi1262_v016227 [Fusarium oxysporum f. sp. raphani]